MDLPIKAPAHMPSRIRELFSNRVKLNIAAAFSDLEAAKYWTVSDNHWTAAVPINVYHVERPFVDSVLREVINELNSAGWFIQYEPNDSSVVTLYLSDSAFRDDDANYEGKEKPVIIPKPDEELLEEEEAEEEEAEEEEAEEEEAEEEEAEEEEAETLPILESAKELEFEEDEDEEEEPSGLPVKALEFEEDEEEEEEANLSEQLLSLLPATTKAMIVERRPARILFRNKAKYEVEVEIEDGAYRVNGAKCIKVNAAAAYVSGLLK